MGACRGWFDKWTKIETTSHQAEQGAKGKQQQRRRSSATEVDSLTAEAEECIRNLQTLRAKLNEVDDENEDGLEHQIEQQLQRWSELEKRMDQISKPSYQRSSTANLGEDNNKVAEEEDGGNIALQAEQVQVLFQEMRTLVNRNTNRQRRKQPVQKTPKGVNPSKDKDSWFSSFLTPQPTGAIDTIKKTEWKLQPHHAATSRNADNGTDSSSSSSSSEWFSSFFAPLEEPAGVVASQQPKIIPLKKGQQQKKKRVDQVDEISGDSSSSSSGGEEYYPASHVERLGTIFEYETCMDSESSNSTDLEDNPMDDEVDDDEGHNISIEDLMCGEGIYYNDKRTLSNNDENENNSLASNPGGDDDDDRNDGTPKITNRSTKQSMKPTMQEDNSSSSSSNDDDSEEKGADSSDSDSKSSGFEVASNEGGNDTIKVEVDLDSLPLLEPIDDETSCSDDDSSIRSKEEDKEAKGLDGSESDSSGYEVASNEGDAPIRNQADSEAPGVKAQSNELIHSRLPAYLHSRLLKEKGQLQLGQHWVWDSFSRKLVKLAAMMILSKHVPGLERLKNYQFGE